MKLAIAILVASAAPAQVRPGDVLVRSNPNGNDVAVHRPGGALVASSNGPQGDWRIGAASTPDLGWVTFRLDIFATPPGWRMMRYDRFGAFMSETLAPELAEVAQYGVATSTEGVILVANGWAPGVRVNRYSASGVHLGHVDVAALGINPQVVCPTDDGGFWVFDDGQVQQVPAQGRRIDADGQLAGAVTFPTWAYDIDLAPDGTFWATQRGSRTVRHLDANGGLIETFDFDFGTTPLGHVRTPSGIAAAPGDTLWVTVRYSTRVFHLTDAGQVIGSFDSGVDLGATEIHVVREPVLPAVPYCVGAPNGTGAVAIVEALGSAVVVDDALTLRARDLPPGAFGYFLVSRQQGFVVQPGGSVGNLCLGGPIGRFVGPGQVGPASASGTRELTVSLSALPGPTGPVAAQPGESWSFQAWYRDLAQGAPTSNFTRGVEVDLR